MSTNELNTFLNSFDRPTNYSDAAWQQVIAQAKNVWFQYLNGESLQNAVDITCKESYLMLVNHEGKLIVQDETLLNYVKNQHVDSWRVRLEEIAFRAIRDKRFEKADRFFTKALKVEATNAMNFYRRALVRIKLMNYKGALEDLTQAINLKANIATFYLKRAQVFRMLDVDFKAMADMNKAIKLDSKSAEAYQLRGNFRAAIGDRAGSRMDMLKAAELKRNGNLGGTELYGVAA
jgi:tetratricopeptide (TPR) repeat protein